MIETFLAVAALYFLYCYFAVKRFSPSVCNTDSSTATATAISPNSKSGRKNTVYVPEDAVLRRHFITHLRGEIEAGMAPRPADSVLQRHHQALITATLEQRLTELGSLQPC
ncbi:hypothetical protein [Methylomonas methanica]|uniref:Uncharacterized protein n=1 Tax=Methylomonas methanica (strain DSM 25384 / MC09) TaxID=857087 RepID=G0A449_METMM|nr:hypothetical protein [Methylomonas methanica]AEF99096.1 hypothetical protein Metme_0653 [Methylomonas methanica MC09]